MGCLIHVHSAFTVEQGLIQCRGVNRRSEGREYGESASAASPSKKYRVLFSGFVFCFGGDIDVEAMSGNSPILMLTS